MGVPPKKQQFEIYTARFASLWNVPYIFSFDTSKKEHPWNLTIPVNHLRTEKHADCIAFRSFLQLRRLNPSCRSGDDRRKNEAFIRDSFLLLSFQNSRKPIVLTESADKAPRNTTTEYVQKSILINGVSVKFLDGTTQKYVPFAASPSMSREGQFLFARDDYEEQLSRKVTLGLQVKGVLPWTEKGGKNSVLLSKWNAYKGLCHSDGWAMDDLAVCRGGETPFQIKEDDIVIVSDYTKKVKIPACGTISYKTECKDKRITLTKDRIEEKDGDLYVNVNDGEGFIDPEAAKWFSLALTGGRDDSITSFQIRLPFVKGMVHAVDFRAYLRENKQKEITDIDGKTHDRDSVYVILTESMVKAYKWFKLSAEDAASGTVNPSASARFLSALENEGHTMFITMKGHTKENCQGRVNLNYQVLQTSGLNCDDLQRYVEANLQLYKGIGDNQDIRKRYFIHNNAPDGNPPTSGSNDNAVIVINDDACEDETEDVAPCEAEDAEQTAADAQTADFDHTEDIESGSISDSPVHLEAAMEINPDLLFCSPILQNRVKDERIRILKDTLQGKMNVHGSSRFLSCDLMELLFHLLPKKDRENIGNQVELIPTGRFYAPGWASESPCAALYRNPHYSRNEHMVLSPLMATESVREKYLGKLYGVVMLSAEGFGAARLGGADFDGDHVGITDDPIYVDRVKCAIGMNKRPEDEQKNGFGSSLPVVIIPGNLESGTAALYKSDGNPESFRTMVADAFLRASAGKIGVLSYAAFEAAGQAYYHACANEQNELPRPEQFTVHAGLEIDAAKKGWELSQPKSADKGAFLNVASALKAESQKNRDLSVKTLMDLCEKNKATSDEKIPLNRIPTLVSEEHPEQAQMKKSWCVKYAECFNLDPNTAELDENTTSNIKYLAEAYQTIRPRRNPKAASSFSGYPTNTLARIILRHSENEEDAAALWKYCTDLLCGIGNDRLIEIRKELEEASFEISEASNRERILESTFSHEFITANQQHPKYRFLTDFSEDGYALLYCLLNRQPKETKHVSDETDSVETDSVYSDSVYSDFASSESETERSQLLIKHLRDKVLRLDSSTLELSQEQRTKLAELLIKVISSTQSLSVEKTLWQLFPEEAGMLLKGEHNDQPVPRS